MAMATMATMATAAASGVSAGRSRTKRTTPKRVVARAGDPRLEAVEQAPPDPILGVSEAFKRSDNPDKLNLGVGAYRTDELKPYVLPVVTKAEESMLKADLNKEYLPIQGLDEFNVATVRLLLGDDSAAVKEGRVATVQSLSGTGSLRVGAAFIERFMPGTTVYLSNPTWGNHKNIFADAGVEWKMYRYFDPDTIGLDFEGMKEDIKAAPDGSVIVLHGCAHNPTGIDPTREQWEEIREICKAKKHLPFFDVAYQGFASGDLDTDSYAPRLFVDGGCEIMCSQSYSKNLGLYGERIGALNLVVSDKDTCGRVLSQLKRIARAMYSNPPVHGARIVSTVIGDDALFNEWKDEMKMMSGRIDSVRVALRKELEQLDSSRDWSFVTSQIGMFSFTGLSKEQSQYMADKWAIYMTLDGRISLAGLSSGKVAYLASALVDALKNA